MGQVNAKAGCRGPRRWWGVVGTFGEGVSQEMGERKEPQATSATSGWEGRPQSGPSC